ncbi:MAG: hypothetical protein HZC10_06860 [Nitrospirae bacterium]|nr:hypothetical protein [Nitrospirota bacterium]
MKMNYLIILAYDEEVRIPIGTQMLLKSFESNFQSFLREWQVIILTPRRFANRILKRKLAEYKVNFESFHFPNVENIYMNKAILYEFSKTNLKRQDKVLYLDYDHLCLRPFALPKLRRHEIMLGSKTENVASAIKSDSVAMRADFMRLTNVHYNSSLIYAYRDDLIAATQSWINLYKKYKNHIRYRDVEEITLSLSCIYSGYKPTTAPKSLQGTWPCVSKSALFHYGGETIAAAVIKNFLDKKISREELMQRFTKKQEESCLNHILSYYDSIQKTSYETKSSD